MTVVPAIWTMTAWSPLMTCFNCSASVRPGHEQPLALHSIAGDARIAVGIDVFGTHTMVHREAASSSTMPSDFRLAADVVHGRVDAAPMRIVARGRWPTSMIFKATLFDQCRTPCGSTSAAAREYVEWPLLAGKRIGRW